MKYDYKAVEAKWQKVWEDEKTFHAEIDHSKPKFYPAATPRWTWWPAAAVSAGTTCCTPWAGTPSACPPRTTP